MIRATLFLVLLIVNLYALKPSVEELSWENGTPFLGFLEKNKIPLSIFYGLSSEDQELAAEISAGVTYQILRDSDGSIAQVLIPVSDELQMHIYKDSSNVYRLDFIPISYQSENVILNIEITRSVTEDIYEYTGSIGLAIAFRDAFKGEKGIDFKKIQKGDRAVIVYSQKRRMGRIFGTPEIYAAYFQTRGKQYTMYKFEDKFYDKNGKEYDKFFLIRPVLNARITSPFTLKRYHPILRRYRAHLGVDYGAPRGTPVRSAGDGKVKFVGTKNGYGKVIIVSHAGGYETLYAHLNGFVKGIKSGQSVKQGVNIGFVGSSGMSTGPHLHFGLYRNNKPINPESMLKVAKSVVDNKDTKKFKQIVAQYDSVIKKSIDTNTSVPKEQRFENLVEIREKNER
ncbi:zinc metallopeptidase, M23 family [Campylobacter mucosalis]|nr:peptidoglycan DD-metalloendopeptidase family protein [Campylobacter mucosalis]QKF63275.1 zinc metallopeptidase, M23 family [Campylobacter mucosalis]